MRLMEMFDMDVAYSGCVSGDERLYALRVTATMMIEPKSDGKSGITAFYSMMSMMRGGEIEIHLHAFKNSSEYEFDYYGEIVLEEIEYTDSLFHVTLHRDDDKDLMQWAKVNGPAGSYVLSNQGKLFLLHEWSDMLHQELTQYRSEYSDEMTREIKNTLRVIRTAIKRLE